MPAIASSFHLGKTLSVPEISGEWTVRAPGNLDQELGRVAYSYAQIPVITQSLSEAQERWCRIPFEARRSAIATALQTLLERRSEWDAVAALELARTKPDLDAEWKQFESFVRGFGGLTLADSDDRVARGVVAIIGSYIWPLVHTVQSAALALLAGNAVVLKPSEKSTLSTLKASELIAGAKPLQEVFSVLVGDRELSRRLACHEGVQAVVFYGSFEVGMRIKQDTLSHTSKETLLYLGAKNPAIVLADAPDATIETLIQDAFLTTGQHCRSVSQIWIEDSIFDDFSKKFHEASKHFKIGSPDEGAYAGALIDPSMLDRYLKFTGISEREGASILMRGKPLELKHRGNYVTPTLAVFDRLTPEQLRKSVSLQTEILSPHVSLIRYKDLDEVRAWGREMTHGLVASVWSQSKNRAQELRADLPFGCVQFNQSTLSWDPARSFQAEKRSGNHAYHGIKLMEQLTLLRA